MGLLLVPVLNAYLHCGGKRDWNKIYLYNGKYF